MGAKAEIRYEFKNAKSFQIYPKKNRQPITKMALSSPSRIERRALVASEKEVNHLMMVANRRFDRINKMIHEKDNSLEKIILENVKAGVHLADEVFIPEYLGFMEVPPGEDDVIRIYARDGHSMTRVDDGWLMILPSGGKVIIKLPNMQIAITVLESLGLGICFDDYLSGKYDPKRKTLEESTYEIITGIINMREKEGQKKIG